MKRFGIRSLLLATAMIAAICGTLFPAMRVAREAAREMSCHNNLKLIGIALLNYESTYDHLPPAIEVMNDGQLWRSWRTHVYPNYMEQMPPVYDASTAWDSPTNLRLLNDTPIPMQISKGGGVIRMETFDRVPWCFACPSCPAQTGTGVNYVVVCGERTAFPKSGPVAFSEISDGLENTILVVESITCMPDWTEPRDLDFETMHFTINTRDGPSISSSHSSGALVCFADGEVYCITPSVTEHELKALLTIDGNENVTREALVARGVLLKQ